MNITDLGLMPAFWKFKWCERLPLIGKLLMRLRMYRLRRLIRKATVTRKFKARHFIKKGTLVTSEDIKSNEHTTTN